MKIALLALAALSFGPAPGAYAKTAANMTGHEQRVALQVLARCNLEQMRPLAVDMALNLGTPNVAGNFGKLGNATCAKRVSSDFARIRISAAALASAIAEELLQGRDLGSLSEKLSDAPAIQRNAEPTFDPAKGSRERFDAMLATNRAERTLDVLGECVVRKSPQLVAGVFQTGMDTPEENSALKAVLPTVSECVASGAIKVRPAQIRQVFAINYLRLAAAAVPGFKEGLL
ncbi:hypothetical protein [Novosphingobium sp. B1]|uniref:hypothetical protein n=1 Tax=Novosphingobium sp. B1 TaxID=1938756 RepID=UPI00111C50EB|nr:hypothetical protein [Novosphingobium sp. B1]